MQIDIPLTEQQRLAVHAAEAGYDDVELFVTEHIRALAQQPSIAAGPRLSPQQLEASLAVIDKSMAELEAGGGLSLEEARRRTLERLEQLQKG